MARDLAESLKPLVLLLDAGMAAGRPAPSGLLPGALFPDSQRYRAARARRRRRSTDQLQPRRQRHLGGDAAAPIGFTHRKPADSGAFLYLYLSFAHNFAGKGFRQ
jgi:hypothetical protein